VGALLILSTFAALTMGCSSDTGTAAPPAVSASRRLEPATSPTQTMGRSAPVRVHIPVIGVDSTLMDLGLQGDGALQVPPSGFPAGWYTGAPTPGQLGPAIIVGHVDWGGQPGVFSRLRELKPGDEVTVERRDGSTAVFRITLVQQYPKSSFPTAVVYGDIDHAGLRLITCGGPFNPGTHSYDDDNVAFADLVGSSAT
jgi:sortase (surface protein transpeptidase)